MASPQKENGYTPISNEIMEALAKIRIPGEARQLLDVILRKTYGWNKKEDIISLSQFVKATGINKPCVCRGLLKLVNMRIVIKKDNDDIIKKDNVIKKDNGNSVSYRLNKDYSKWINTPKKITIIKKDNEPLSKKIHTKESLKTKRIYTSCPHQKIVDLYHEILPELPEVIKWTPARKAMLKARWDADKEVQLLDWWKGYFEHVRGSKFLMGLAKPNGREIPFMADLEWLIRPSNFIKVREGKYH